MSLVHSQRGRAIIVRDGPGLSELAEAIRRSASDQAPALQEVGDIYDALAEVAVVPTETPGATLADDRARDTVRTVAVSLRAAGDDPAALRAAFRRIDPNVRLVLLAPRGAADVAEEAGFDDVVFLPGASADLAAALQIKSQMTENTHGGRASAFERVPPTPPAPPTDRVETPLGLDQRAMRTDRRPPQRSSSTLETPRVGSGPRDVVEMVIDDAIQAFAARSGRRSAIPTAAAAEVGTPNPRRETSVPTPSIDVPADRSLGDTDLVHAVMQGNGTLASVALRLIRAQLRVTDLRLIASSETASEQGLATRVDVRCGGETLATLVSNEATASDLAPWSEWLGHWLLLDREQESLRTLAYTDELTGAGNRRAFERVAEETIAEARRERRSLSLMYFDIDDFKNYNDRFGHNVGDEVLCEVLELLRSVIRRGDHVFRVGGDEFVVLFADVRGARVAGSPPAPQPPLESVETITQRFRARVCELSLPQLGVDGRGTISVSAGVATYPWDGGDAGTLLHHADQLALQSKRAGKNMITFGPGARFHCGDA